VHLGDEGLGGDEMVPGSAGRLEDRGGQDSSIEKAGRENHGGRAEGFPILSLLNSALRL
jgi:hypothetical protein